MISRIEEHIKRSGLRKDYIADKLGITTRQLRYYEVGKSMIPLDKAFDLAELLNVKVEELYIRENKKDRL